MALADAYATAAEFRAISKYSDGADDDLIQADLVAVSRLMERALGCFFNKDDVPVGRIFYPNGASRFLRVSDASRGGAPIASAAGLTLKFDLDLHGSFDADPAVLTTDYQLWPPNADKGPEPEPWTALYLPPWSSWGAFPFGIPVQVTAIWGWPAVPAAIKRACVDLTSILRMESPRATRQVNTSMHEVLSTSGAAQDILDDLISVYSVPVVV